MERVCIRESVEASTGKEFTVFVAMRDLRAARGRFALISVVVLLVALLVSFLSGLTAGLRHQNVSAIEAMNADTVVFADTGAGASFDESRSRRTRSTLGPPRRRTSIPSESVAGKRDWPTEIRSRWPCSALMAVSVT